MRNLIMALAAVFVLCSFTRVDSVLHDDVTFVSKTIMQDDYGRCHIQIVNTRTQEIVYEIVLPANTPEECERMGRATLNAVVNGEL